MKFNKFIILIILAFFLIIAYLFWGKQSEEDIQKRNIMFQEIVNSNVDELSIVIYMKNNYSYLRITDKEIIKKFIDILKNDTYKPNRSTGQYNCKFIITLHSKNNSNLIILRSDTYNSSVKSDSVEVTIFDIKGIDIYDLYIKSKMENEDFLSLFNQSYGFGKYSLRNNKLNYLINNYFKDKGLVYNPYTKKWTRNMN